MCPKCHIIELTLFSLVTSSESLPYLLAISLPSLSIASSLIALQASVFLLSLGSSSNSLSTACEA